jgi:hypothetical protein
MFIKIMTCYAQHRSKGIQHYNKVLIVHSSCYHGYRKKEQLNSSIPMDSMLSRLYRGVQLYPYRETRRTSLSRASEIRVASHLQHFPNLARMSYERFKRVPGQCPRHSRPMPPPSSFTDKQVATSNLAYRPHPWYVVCTGGYSDLHIPIHGPYCSTSYVALDPTLTTTYPSPEQDIQVIIKITILGILVLSQISKVSQVVPSLILVVNYLGVTSYTRECEFPSHARLLPLHKQLTNKH